MEGRAKICCSCSKFTSLKSPGFEDLGCALAVVSVDIKVLSRGIAELERKGERKRKREKERERERERSLLSKNKVATQYNYVSITSDLQHKLINIQF